MSLLAILAAATIAPPVGCDPAAILCFSHVLDTTTAIPVSQGEMGVCGRDPNRPDLEVCIEGDKRRIMLRLPLPLCPEAGTKRDDCVNWTAPKRESE